MLTQSIKAKALSLGFDLVGVTPATVHPHLSFFDQWLSQGYAGDMAYLARGRDKRADPKKILEGAQSIICCGLVYNRGYPRSIDMKEEGRGWFSNYSWGDDYHEVVLKKLEELRSFILSKNPNAQIKAYVDTGSILERSYAASAGLGWIGKNTCLIDPKKGSYFFIGELITDLILDYDQPQADHCGKCNRCLEACPTQALTPYELNATKCISYLTIEYKGKIPKELQKKMGHHLVGCDICQDVCPWNQKAPLSHGKSFEPRPDNFYPFLDSLKKMTQEEFSKRFKGSPIKRVKWEGLQRNIKVVEGNQKKE